MDRRVSAWAAPFVEPETHDEPAIEGEVIEETWRPSVSQPKVDRGSKFWLRQQIDAWHAQSSRLAARHRSLVMRGCAWCAGLFIVSQIPPLPSVVHWLSFIGAIAAGGVAMYHVPHWLTHRINARMEPAD